MADKTYRHDVTGLVDVYDERVALADPHLIEVHDGAKPLAYLPIPPEVVEKHLALRNEAEREDSPVDSAPKTKRSK